MEAVMFLRNDGINAEIYIPQQPVGTHIAIKAWNPSLRLGRTEKLVPQNRYYTNYKSS
jgi:hypothetical protein